MKLNVLILSLCSLLFFCCNSNKEEKSNTEKETKAETSSNEKKTNYYQRLEGTIGDKEVVANLSKYENSIWLCYYYKDRGEIVSLYKIDTALKNDSLQFMESSSYRGDEDYVSPLWNILLTPDGLKGEWISGDKKKRYPIALHENYPAGSTRFNVVGTSESFVMPFARDTVSPITTLMLLEPESKTAQSLFLQHIADTSGKFSSLSDYLKDAATTFIKNTQAEFDTMKMNKEIVESDMHYTLNYEESKNALVLYNDNDYVVLNIKDYWYRGGAHGLEGSTILCFDMKENKLLKLTDIITADSATLQRMVEENFRQQQKLKTTDSLSSILFENRLPANENFYFTSSLLGFIYQPYEVAAYVYGFIEPAIPFSQLKPYLNSKFAKRMKLQ